jgi:hypothetical protein
MSNEQVKLCKDCKWMRRDPVLFCTTSYATCANPRAFGYKLDMVSGKYAVPFCSIERGQYKPLTNCGPEANFFEEKERNSILNFWRRK